MRQAVTSSVVRNSQPTLHDVSRLSGVSSATVSRVFSGSAKVSQPVRERVLAAARQLSYEPSIAARVLAGAKMRAIGAIFPEIASGFYADILAGIDEVCAEHSFDVMASFVGTNRKRPDLIRRLLRQGRVDALILLNLHESTDLNPRELEGLPIILVDREITGAKLPVVGIDNVGGAEAMIEHLFEQGHRKISLLTGPTGNFDSEQRLLGARQAANRLGISIDESSIWRGEFTVASGHRAAREMLDSRQPLPDAIFCFNDVMAIGLISEFHRAGISVPGKVAVAGFDNIETAEHISLTSVACPMRLMGQVAARWAIDSVMKDEKPTGSHRLQVRLAVRNSSAGRRGSPTHHRARVTSVLYAQTDDRGERR